MTLVGSSLRVCVVGVFGKSPLRLKGRRNVSNSKEAILDDAMQRDVFWVRANSGSSDKVS